MAYLKIVSDTCTPDWITSKVGVEPDVAVAKGEIPPGSASRRPLRWNRWELRETGGGSSNIDDLVSALYSRLTLVSDGLKSLPKDKCEMELVIVGYYSPGDETSHGFHLDLEFVKLLAIIGADIDVDQYLIYN
jgi:hypothetical protein